MRTSTVRDNMYLCNMPTNKHVENDEIKKK